MPELPEVETVVRDLRPLIVGRRIATIRSGKQALRQPWQTAWNKSLRGLTIQAITRRGKWINVELADEPVLLIHLGMTGQLTVAPNKQRPADHTHLRFAFDDDRELRFRDVRRFGSAAFFPTRDEVKNYLESRLGPEPFELDAAYFRRQLQSANRPLKAFLLDQTIIAGVGNIYADEACFRARLHPGRRANTLGTAEANRLRIAIEEVLTKAVEGRGSTIRDYIGGSGLRGSYQHEFHAYGRTGEPCTRCGTALVMERIAGRSSHFCGKCQTLKDARH